MLMTPPLRNTSSEVEAFSESSENWCRKMFVSKNALVSLMTTTGMGFQPVELEVLGDETAIFAQARKHVLTPLGPLDLQRASSCDANIDVVALFEVQDLHDHGGQPDGQAVSPLRDLHIGPLDIHWVGV